jgi:hypothetical protein
VRQVRRVHRVCLACAHSSSLETQRRRGARRFGSTMSVQRLIIYIIIDGFLVDLVLLIIIFLIMSSSGAAEKPKFHEGKLKPYPHEELGREVGKPFSLAPCCHFGLLRFWSLTIFLLFLLLFSREAVPRTPSSICCRRNSGLVNVKLPTRRFGCCVKMSLNATVGKASTTTRIVKMLPPSFTVSSSRKIWDKSTPTGPTQTSTMGGSACKHFYFSIPGIIL